MKIRELFRSDVTRDIPPVVYFHEQSPEKIRDEVREYIITGGWPEGHPSKKRIETGIHEHYVNLLTRIAAEVAGQGDPANPASWISGFYGSGKSTFAKILGLALDGRTLPDGRLLAQAWLVRDTSPKADELRAAWDDLQAKIDPIAVIFDIGGVARGDEHIHSAVVRQVQGRLGYCATDVLVADTELRLERDGHYDAFLEKAHEVLGRPWSAVKDTHMVEDDFSLVLSRLFPERYEDPMAWINSRVGQQDSAVSAEDAARAVKDMLDRRAPGKTVFIVIDEVSQYIYRDEKRMLALQSLVSALGTRLRGRAWLLATGQQQLDEQSDVHVLGKMKDRFPPRFRVHLSATNIRDVVHKRLLQKKPAHEPGLREMFQKYRSNLRLFGYDSQDIAEQDFVDVYPMLPGHVDLILEITSAIRTRSARSQGDDYAIRGLLQLLGELFRTQGVADLEVGALITLDQVFEVQSSSLDADMQNTLARIFAFCARVDNDLAARCAKAVALLEQLQQDEGGRPTPAKLVAQCLYQNVADGDNEPGVTEALELLRRENLLGYSEKNGYKIQSSAGQDWERERRDISISGDEIYDLVKDALEHLVGETDRPKLQGRPFVWAGLFNSEHSHQDVPLRASREEAPITADFRFVPMEQQELAHWVNRSSESSLRDRIVWVCSSFGPVQDAARQLGKSRRMAKRYAVKRESIRPEKRRLLLEEETREEDLTRSLRQTVADAFMGGRIYFRGADARPEEHGGSFTTSLAGAGTKRLPDIYSHFVPTNVTPAELKQITVSPLSGPAKKFFEADLGILEEDAGRIVATCTGPLPTRVFELIQREQGISGATLLRRFSDPPFGYPANVVKACVAGLLHAGKVRLVPTGSEEITSIGDQDVQNLFEKDRAFKTTDIFPAGEARIKPQDRARIREMFATVFDTQIEPENDAIADAVFRLLPPTATQLREVERALNRLPGRPDTPETLQKLHKAFEDCLRSRQVEPTVVAVRKHLDVLRDGVGLLNAYRAELTEDAIEAVRKAHTVLNTHLSQLYEVAAVDPDLQDVGDQVGSHMAQERPWRDIESVEPLVERIRVAYAEERRRRIAQQEAAAEAARSRVKGLSGFETLTPDQRHTVLRPITEALVETHEEAVAPSVAQLLVALDAELADAEAEAVARLDALRAEAAGEVIVKVSLEIRNREIRNEADVDALLDEIRTRLLEQLAKGNRIRLS